MRPIPANDSSAAILSRNILRARENVSFFQINSHKCINSNLTLAMHSRNRNMFCYMVQEPYCTKDGKLLHLNGGERVIIRDQTMSEGNLKPVRSVIIHSKNFPVTPVQQLCSKDLAAGLVTYSEKGRAAWQKQSTLLISFYWDITFNNIPNDLTRAVQYAKDNNIDIQINMDSNCHSTLFGSRDQNERGNTLEEFMAEHNLVPGNVGNENTFVRGNSGTVIDLTLGTPRAMAQIRNWRVHRENIMDSDHRLIEMEITYGEPIYEYVRDLSRINWKAFSDKLDFKLKNEMLPKEFKLLELESAAENLQNSITSILNYMAPVRQRVTKERFKWWTDELDKLWKRREEVNLSKGNSKTKRELYNKLTKDFNKIKRFEQRKAKRTFFSESNTPALIAKMDKVLNSQPRNQIGLLRKTDGSFTTSIDESIKIIMEKCFPDSKAYNRGKAEELAELEKESNAKGVIKRESLPYLTVYRLRESIKSTKTHKACGPDEIKPIVLKNFSNKTLDLLKDIYEGCIAAKYTPLIWRKSNVVLIPKPNKPDYQKAGAFRPITLANHLFKTLEKLILWHITETNLKETPLQRNQHAFRNDASTESAALEVLTQIENGLYKGKITLAIYADIAGAFDSVTGDAIIQAMVKRNVDINIIKWYEHYIANRIATLQVRSTTVIMSLSRGCPQGGCLSTLAWNLVFDELLIAFKKHGVNIVGFADDACLLVTGDSLGPLIRRINRALLTLKEWADERGLVISKEKTVAMIFTKKNKIEMPSIKVNLDGSNIEFVNEANYLGMTFTSKLNWGKHIKNKLANAKKKIFKYKGAIKANWGPPQRSIRWLYTGIVRPGITYASLIWGKAVTNKYEAELRRVQGLALLMQGLFRKNTPRRSLEILSGVEPLHLFIYNQMLKAGYRNLAHIHRLSDEYPFAPKQCTFVFIKTELKRLGISLNLECLDRIPKFRYHERAFQLKEGTFRNKWPKIEFNCCNIFTDGSKIGGASGIGILVDNKDKSIEISEIMPSYSTVFQCEVRAIAMACDSVKTLANGDIQFYVDSQAAIKALFADLISSRTVLATIIALETLSLRNKVTINWIKAHNGHSLNDIADQLAKDGASSLGPINRIPMPDAHVKSLIDEETQLKWNRGWVNCDGHRQTKLFFPVVDKRRIEHLYNISKSIYSQAVRWITGFNGLAYHNNKVDPSETPEPYCRLCETGALETSAHLITNCPVLHEERVNAFQIRYDLEEGDLNRIKMKALSNFLKQRRVQIIENINEFPLLFIEDYKTINHDLIEAIATQSASNLYSRYTDEDSEESEVDHRSERRNGTADGSRLLDRQGIG